MKSTEVLARVAFEAGKMFPHPLPVPTLVQIMHAVELEYAGTSMKGERRTNLSSRERVTVRQIATAINELESMGVISLIGEGQEARIMQIPEGSFRGTPGR